MLFDNPLLILHRINTRDFLLKRLVHVRVELLIIGDWRTERMNGMCRLSERYRTIHGRPLAIATPQFIRT